MKQIDTELVEGGIENQGVDYYLMHYALTDLEDTELEPLIVQYRSLRMQIEKYLEHAGVRFS